ncbi:hypothetical protein K435DRAFT_792670 [Dendrothele bispora CBS 962.96]|uniref:Uncharacterized protein n=1 Tax=Dendrothele bispora (strain CBS 962.96) TaxID=1314807 RepID=A0A4S8MIB4_DENBC|nr:hypothetical protein K435DRAFT_792670 [Dendrothele bispora CBS 962.96]
MSAKDERLDVIGTNRAYLVRKEVNKPSASGISLSLSSVHPHPPYSHFRPPLSSSLKKTAPLTLLTYPLTLRSDKYVSRAEYDDLRARVDKLEALVVRLRGDDTSHRQGIGGSVGTTTTITPIYGPPGHGGHGHGRADYDVQPGRMLLGSNTEPSGMVAVKEEHSDDGSGRRSVSGARSRSPGSTGMGGGGGRRGSESFGVPSSDSEDRLGPLVSSSRGRDRESMGHSRSSSGGTSVTSGVETGNITGPGKGGVAGGRLGRGDGGGAKEYHHGMSYVFH